MARPNEYPEENIQAKHLNRGAVASGTGHQDAPRPEPCEQSKAEAVLHTINDLNANNIRLAGILTRIREGETPCPADNYVQLTGDATLSIQLLLNDGPGLINQFAKLNMTLLEQLESELF